MSRALSWIAAAAFGTVAGRADPVAPMDFTRYQQRAGELFNPKFVTDSASDLATATENLLLMCQAVAAVIVVAGMIAKIRKDQVQMEGIASMMLKVAFIALIPTLRVHTLETANAAASAIGYEAASSGGTPSPMMSNLWGLLREWAPPGSPYLDALETQGAEPPASGKEEEWALQAWNWAKGVGTTTGNQFDAVWQSVSGGMRAGAVFTGCGAMACVSSVTLTLTYVSEILRALLFFAGCAVLPVFVAALGIDALRAQAVRFIVAVVSVACWPIGWALANSVTTVMARGLIVWINSTSAAALTLGAGDPVPPLAIAAPYVGWGALFLFMGATTAICLWVVGTSVYAPLAIGKLVSAGANAAAVLVGAADSHRSSAAHGARAIAAPAAREPASVSRERQIGAAGRVRLEGPPPAVGVRQGHPGRGASAFHLGSKPPAPSTAQAVRVSMPSASETPLRSGKSGVARIAQWLPPPPRVGGN